jgi:hypothetical protein
MFITGTRIGMRTFNGNTQKHDAVPNATSSTRGGKAEEAPQGLHPCVHLAQWQLPQQERAGWPEGTEFACTGTGM